VRASRKAHTRALAHSRLGVVVIRFRFLRIVRRSRLGWRAITCPWHCATSAFAKARASRHGAATLTDLEAWAMQMRSIETLAGQLRVLFAQPRKYMSRSLAGLVAAVRFSRRVVMLSWKGKRVQRTYGGPAAPTRSLEARLHAFCSPSTFDAVPKLALVLMLRATVVLLFFCTGFVLRQCVACVASAALSCDVPSPVSVSDQSKQFRAVFLR